ncbi:EPIDERMAL PATTERNING FACTOR-like protein 9 [Olea europaea var. sylvestris]|uniref:EPIDERMAL PATTERNING FACTOR-like protein 9 n=1 Tax=Olea europaea var. sylvestris TaxID=158386 RepID=UPI000C1D86FB|nr:EPIDERMAL PATTERNING FACTOR-like protein 9 [Olea europaea var. sylvestris]
MANNSKRPKLYLLLLYLFSATLLIQGSRIQMQFPHHRRGYHILPSTGELNLKDIYSRRSLIGSVAPTCTYNECKGCKYKCRAEQVPVEGNDPRNSPYHYKCVCHR